MDALDILGSSNANLRFVLDYDYSKRQYLEAVINEATLYNAYIQCSDKVSAEFLRYYQRYGYVSTKDYLVTKETLRNIGWKGTITATSIYSLNMMLQEYEINTTERLRHFFTQVLIESGSGLYLREGEYLLSEPYNYSQKEYENLYNTSNKRYSYKDRGVGYIQTTFSYNHQAFATYLLMKDYPELDIKFYSPAQNDSERIAQNYQDSIRGAMENGIDVLNYEIIVEKGTDYIANNYAWDISGYWWMVNEENQKIDKLNPDDKYEVDNVTDDVNYNLGSRERAIRIEKYVQIKEYIR